MSVTITCPKCGKSKPGNAKLSGQKVVCPDRATQFSIPIAKATAITEQVESHSKEDLDKHTRDVMSQKMPLQDTPKFNFNGVISAAALLASILILGNYFSRVRSVDYVTHQTVIILESIFYMVSVWVISSLLKFDYSAKRTN